MYYLTFLVGLYATFLSSAGYALGWNRALHLGDCSLETGENPDVTLLRLCSQPTLDMDALTDFRSIENLHQVGRLYLGGHHEHHSLHFQGFLHQTISLNSSATVLDRYTELAAWRLGNFSLDHWTLTVGKQPLPFGLHFNPIQGAYYQFSSESFWQSPEYGASIGWDDWQKIRIEGGWASDTMPAPDSGKKQRTETSGRFLYDFSALNGTRFIVSAAGDNIGARKVGAALLHNEKGSLFQIEIIRQKNLQDSADADYLQLFRLSISGPYNRGTRSIFLYEDVHNSHRLGLFLQEWKGPFPFYYHLAVGYRKEESESGPNRWVLFTGMSLRL